MSINKSTLIDRTVRRTGVDKNTATELVNGMLQEIRQALKSGESVNLVGFGSFEIRERAARLGRNPRTGEQVPIEASRGVGFKASKKLKESL